MGGGPGYLLQPSMGFLLGLIPAAWIVGRLTEQKADPRPGDSGLPGRIGRPVRGGRTYMYAVLHLYLGRDMTLWAVVWSGMLIYLPGDALKIAAVAAVSRPIPGGETGINPVLVPYR